MDPAMIETDMPTTVRIKRRNRSSVVETASLNTGPRVMRLNSKESAVATKPGRMPPIKAAQTTASINKERIVIHRDGRTNP
jgi:hypothetical protein